MVVGLLMAGEQARMVFSDPPYNVPIEGHVLTRKKEGRGQDGDEGGAAARTVRHREFAMAAGEDIRRQPARPQAVG